MRKPRNAENSASQGFRVGALNQSRTGDLILTMDALCLLSYEGVFCCDTVGAACAVGVARLQRMVLPANQWSG